MKDAVQKLNTPPAGKKAFGVALIPGQELKTCYSRKIPVPFALEELFPEDIWDLAETSGWLEERSNLIALYKFDRRDRSFDDYLKETLPEKHLRRLALNKVKQEKKEMLVKHVCGIVGESEKKRVLEGVKATMEECLKQLGVI